MQTGSIAVVLPCYNEAGNIARVLQECLDGLGELETDFEIIVVDDGSSDTTAKIVKEAILHESRIRLIQHPYNLGYASALKSGIRAACKEILFFMDSDGQFRFKEVGNILHLVPAADVVIGYRIKRMDSFLRRVN